ncbi:MAG: cysteine desulfurase [Chloroflexi bacterium]|nr:cysteine desulfurase [Chloroflexota bacterium]MCH2531861.1 cysteine desulfurase [Dehalococcoidia bacterium]HCH36053.1 cysteine desulfurase [Dehalococcoidia bacterium]|tara:strand:- start:1112 stop:2350 length:1239 start_codon:yes stop_codon:yes gene_type:complete
MYDINSVRKDFPILHQKINGHDLVYLDNAATSQKPKSVIDELVNYYSSYNANVHRGAHTLAVKATVAYEEAREKIAAFINAPSPENIIFVRNTTEAINLIAHTWAMDNIREGDRIVSTEIEHHSNLVPWQHVANTQNATLELIKIDSNYELDLSELDQIINSKTRLVALTHMSNVLGTIVPVKTVVEAAKKVDAKVLIDGAQSVPHMRVDVQDIGCDFFTFSGHKMLGPTGIGVLYVSTTILKELNPFLRGGEMVLEVTYDRASWAPPPMKFEAGTPNIADAIGLGVAVDYLNEIGIDMVRQHEVSITNYALERFHELEEITTYGPNDTNIRGGVISFYIDDVHPHDISQVLDSLGIAIRAGHHCAMPLVKSKLHVPATARASFYLYNTEREVDLLIDGLKKTMEYFSNANS